ncbi:flagellar assembly protein FliH [Treponema zuelzerae]|uniref:Flagellar assembly protein FliH n=1 Tax=Teretinema zuelzerae TaxID=156 RepID=A0AAE3EG75_9SPIR|nr:flagellar assembly protein FliH [Teretinema zuelzerae]MCD1653238.1 flagellar assembly protein FliH [Teretinema zuelzerae]
MAKTVFRPNEIKVSNEHVQLQLARKFVVEEPVEESPEEPIYEGPTADDLRREAEHFRMEFERDKQAMLAEAQSRSEEILKEAEKAAFDEVKRKTDQAQIIKRQAQDEADSIIAQAEKRAREIIAEAEMKKDAQLKDGYKDGFASGQEAGFKEGNLEAERLTDRLHTIIERMMDKRQEILSETEQQIVDLVLMMTRKIVKVISENQRNIVVSNVVQALRKVKGRGDVIIRVNLADVAMTTQHIKDFLSSAENVKNITVVEDTTVDRGGCVIETDFGAIDARISSQLNEIEQRILEVSPIRTRVKTANPVTQD